MELADVQGLVGRVAAGHSECADVGVVKAAPVICGGCSHGSKPPSGARPVDRALSSSRRNHWPNRHAPTSTRRKPSAPRRDHRTDPSDRYLLDAGRVSGEHVDVLTRHCVNCNQRRANCWQRMGRGCDDRRTINTDDFARTVRTEARRLERDGDGRRLERHAGRSGFRPGWTRRPTWVAGQRPGTHRRWSPWRPGDGSG